MTGDPCESCGRIKAEYHFRAKNGRRWMRCDLCRLDALIKTKADDLEQLRRARAGLALREEQEEEAIRAARERAAAICGE